MLAGHLQKLDEVSEDGLSISSDGVSSESGSKGLDTAQSETRTSSSNNYSSKDDQGDVVGIHGSRQVFRLKMTVFLVLTSAAVAVAIAIYLITANSEQTVFEATFEAYTNQVFESFKFNLERKFGAVEAFSVSITSLANDFDGTWPNYVVPDFDLRASNTRELADAASVSFSPIVTRAQRSSWEDFVGNNTQWIQDSIEYEAVLASLQKEQKQQRQRHRYRKLELSPETDANGVPQDIFYFDFFGDAIHTHVDESDGPYLPVWQHFPVIPELINMNMLTLPFLTSSVEATLETASAVIGVAWESQNVLQLNVLAPWESDSRFTRGEPISTLVYPVFDALNGNLDVIGVLTLYVDWRTYFERTLPTQARGVIVVLKNECKQVYTYRLDGLESTYIGEGDRHDPKYDSLAVTVTLEELIVLKSPVDDKAADVKLNKDFCPYSLSVYPSEDLENDFLTNEPVIYTIGSVVVFFITGAVFLLYNFIVERRMNMVVKRLVQSRAIVSSLFPAAVRERLFRSDDSQSTNSRNKQPKKRGEHTKMRIKSFLHDKPDKNDHKHNAELRPIADLFPHTTVMFADIAGFTSWSSERDPAHVFTLLQTLYHAFDTIAKKRGVFKVETIGDCYVAVTGLPDPQPDHAVRMAKFAHECMKKMSDLIQVLKSSLGEDTLELAMRFGLHSGPVTAGVLRGEKSRFQLFGTTVSVAAQMEHTGKKNKIQISQETADLITEAGKSHWIFHRIDELGSRGGIQTYWVEPQSHAQELKAKNSVPTRVMPKPGAPVDTSHNSQRLIDWNVDLLKRILQRLVAARKDAKIQADLDATYTISSDHHATVRDEIVEFIPLPKYSKDAAKTDPKTILLGDEVEKQLREYVKMVASMYHDNPFHSFKHASNVCTNASKLLGCIVDEDLSERTSDPLTQFACVYSALIHDLDHQGLTNMLLIKEKPHIAALYRNKSVAEQNSVDLAWNLLMDPEFEDLQRTIFCNDDEFKRFRGLVVNVVMATDIFDKELNTDRNTRWLKAFELAKEDSDELSQMKATIIIELVMQVADIMHTMQHFHSYQRWNERLFEEMYMAYHTGKSSKDPSSDWYQGEIWFFDNCVIPLAQRIKSCGIFGVQGDDCLKNAIANKKEWAVKGGDIVKTLVENAKRKVEIGPSPAITNDHAPKEQHDVSERKEKEPDNEKEKEKKDPDKHLIEWNVDLFKRMLRHILAQRAGENFVSQQSMRSLAACMKEGSVSRDDIERIIDIPDFDKEASKLKMDPDSIELSQAVQDQLRDYISFIAAMYRDNEFHNFKHASNVSMSSSRYMQRIVDESLKPKIMHPLVQFAVAFAALIHDVDHPGVSNAQLVKENSRLAVVYNYKSVAEQNSLDLAWSVLMESEYKDLRAAICGTHEDLERFRKLLVNSVMATDLFDEELIAERDERWRLAFSKEHQDPSMSESEFRNLRATVVVEHVMQASDIGHTMQHFHSFKRWNERLFFEVYAAFENGRLEEDPSKGWYGAELRFFDNVVLPLARKLKDCDMFGVAGDDAIRCAQSNRKEWVVKGDNIVLEFKKKYEEAKAEKSQKKEGL